MARITVEDCIDKIPNFFELVLMASKRARKLNTGAAKPLLDWEKDKATVVALREIAAGYTFNDDDEDEGDSDGTSKNEARSILGSDSPFANSSL